MKVLILSCNTGGGHNSAALAARDAFVQAGHEAVFLDVFSIASQKLSGRVSRAYLFSTRLPFLFHLAYWAGKKVSRPGRQSPVYAANTLHAGRLHRYLQEHPCDVIVTTHLFAAEQLTCLKKRGQLTIPTVGVATDYTCIPFWEETDLDYYVIPQEELVEEFTSHGMKKEKLQPFGIPVSPHVRQEETKQQARDRLHEELLPGLDVEKPFLLIMSGSMGFGNSGLLVDRLLRREQEISLCVVCGNNRKQQKRLQMLFGKQKGVYILGYTDQVPRLLHAADVVFTKPGGLTTTEAAVSRTPLVHTAPIPGCETANAAFFAAHGMAVSAQRAREQCDAGLYLLQNPPAAEEMKERQKDYLPGDAADRLVTFCESCVAEQKGIRQTSDVEK